MRTEILLEQKCVKYSKTEGWMNCKLHKLGYPDRLFFKDNHFIFIEFKDPKGVVAKAQEYTISMLRKKGCEVYIVKSFDDFKTKLIGEKVCNKVLEK